MIGGMREIHLVGVVPPDHVERILTDLKRSLFHTFSLVSGLALGPIVPLGYPDKPPAAPESALLPRCPTLAAAGWLLEEETLLLSVEPAAIFSDLRRALGLPQPTRRSSGEAASGEHGMPLPLGPGLFIARLAEPAGSGRWLDGSQAASRPTPAEILASLTVPLHLEWSASRIVCWTLRYPDRERWWEAIFREERWSVRLGRQPRTG